MSIQATPTTYTLTRLLDNQSIDLTIHEMALISTAVEQLYENQKNSQPNQDLAQDLSNLINKLAEV